MLANKQTKGTSMLANIENMQKNTKQRKHAITKTGKETGYPKGTNVCLYLEFVVPLHWNTDYTCAKKQSS